MAKKTVPAAFAAPPWQPDLSEFVILWHGCTTDDKDRIEQNAIDLSYCAVDTDFGRGFYTTTLERQARQWAWDRFFDWQAKNPRRTGNQPAILRFRVRRFGKSARGTKLTCEDGLDELDSLSFVIGDFDNADYWSLVQHCRQSTPADPAAGTAQIIHDHKHRRNGGWYELVSGPVAAFWTQRVAMDDADELSFHQVGVDLLNALIDQGKGKGPQGMGDPDYYQWMVVT